MHLMAFHFYFLCKFIHEFQPTINEITKLEVIVWVKRKNSFYAILRYLDCLNIDEIFDFFNGAIHIKNWIAIISSKIITLCFIKILNIIFIPTVSSSSSTLFKCINQYLISTNTIKALRCIQRVMTTNHQSLTVV